MKKSCIQCSAEFEITQDDLAFYEKVSPVFNGKKELIPPPTMCPACRMQRRLTFRNEKSLHHRMCDKSGKSIISMYAPHVPFPVFDNELWWKDDWDAHAMAQEYDETQPFLPQFKVLWERVPKMARVQQGVCENSQYTNCAADNKNCYLLFNAAENEDCLYGSHIDHSRSCMDNYHAYYSELCYQCVDCQQCYRTLYAQNCVNCRDSAFLKNCIGCHDCFGCINLRNASYCIFNEQFEKEIYERKIKEFKLHTSSGFHALHMQIEPFFLQHPHCYYQGTQNENVSGNYIFQGKNVFHSFDVNYMEDAKFCNGTRNMRDVYDVSYYGVSSQNELLYECEGVGHGVSNIIYSKLIWGGSSNCAYSYECFASHHLFGCAGLRHASYCILNKQYTKEEYEKLVPQIIENMRNTGEWGEFFPITLAPFGYNEIAAQEYFPLSRNEALASGWQWHDDEPNADQYMGPPYVVPDDITNVNDDILHAILTCSATRKPYKIIPQELAFYRNIGVPIPQKCPDQRYAERIALRNPAKLYPRTCAKCSKDIQTTYAPERPAVRGSEEPSGSRREIVYCDRCYLDSVY